MVISRREVLAVGAFGSASLLLPLPSRSGGPPRLATSRLPQPFQVELPVPPTLTPVRSTPTTDYYQLTMRPAPAEIIPGYATTIFGYNGIHPGPTVLAQRGRIVVVRQINALPDVHPTLGYRCTTSVHLHGNASLPQYDGWAEDLTPPGFFKDYVYPNEQDARTMWYHDHAVDHTAQNVYLGLAGFYLTSEGLNLPLPKDRFDIPLMIKDALFTADRQLLFDDRAENGLMGDVILVNGKPWPVLKVERRKYLFRILNASVARAYRLALSTGEPFTFVETDGGLMPVPQSAAEFRIGAAERYGVVIDFARYPIGQQVVLRNLDLKNNEDFATTRQVMRFDVTADASDLSNNTVPAVLNRGGSSGDPMPLQPSQAVRTRDWEFKRRRGAWSINGEFWDPGRIDANPAFGDVEIWRFQNTSGGWFHPIHTHLVDFRILDRNGRPPQVYELGAKDTTYVGENETLRVIARFVPHRGRYMLHCHNLVHEDTHMMTNFEVGQGGPSPLSAPPSPLPAPPL
jgi:FtsP/CotA-like multicopper oxidase with cupredoxin domain